MPAAEPLTQANLKRAIEAAYSFYKDQYSSKGQYENELLESALFDEDEQCWRVTFGFDLPSGPLPGTEVRRKFVTFLVGGNPATRALEVIGIEAG